MSIWRQFMNALPLTLVAMALTAVVVLAATGTTDSSAAPGSTSSYTLEDLYQRLTNGTGGTQSSFTEPGVAPGTGTMHDINALMAAAPETDPNGATSADVLTGTTFWGLNSGEWGVQTGGMPLGSDVTGADGSITFAIPDGYYSGRTATATDSDLLAGNILDTADIFGVAGGITTQGNVTGADGSISFAIPDGYYSGRTATASDSDLVAGNILDTADIFGVAGSITTQGNVTGADGLISFNIPDGYYSGRTATASDSDLVAGNILDTVTIFGVTGSLGSGSDVTGADGSITFNIPDACYSGNTATATDADLLAENIKRGVTLFGVTGTYQPGWSWYTRTSIKTDLNDLDMVSAADGWAVGEGGRIYHWDGTAWSLHTTTAEGSDLFAVDMVSATDGWAAGLDNYLYHYDGTDWNSDTSLFSSFDGIADVEMIDANNGWAVGSKGSIGAIYHWDGTSWSLNSTKSAVMVFLGLDMLSETDGWAVGSSGYIYHWDGTSWSYHSTTAEGAYLYDVAMLTTNYGWAVGEDGYIYRWNGSTWGLHTTTKEGSTLMSIDVLGISDGWAVGANGRIYHWDGAKWIHNTTGYYELNLMAIQMIDAGEGWTVGGNGHIYHYEN